MEVRTVAISGSVHVSTGAVKAEERIGEKSCEGGREGMEVLFVAISESVHVSTGAEEAEERVGEKSCEGGRDEVRVMLEGTF